MRKEPARPDLVKKILKELKKHPEGLWIRKLSRILSEPVMTVQKYVNRPDYAGKFIEIEKMPKEMGGNRILKLREAKE